MPTVSLSYINRSVDAIARAIKELDDEGYSLCEVREALNDIDKAQKEREERDELRKFAVTAKESKGCPRRCVIAYRYGGRVGTVFGTEYHGGFVFVKSTPSSPEVIDGHHFSVESMKAKLTQDGIAYHLEYID